MVRYVFYFWRKIILKIVEHITNYFCSKANRGLSSPPAQTTQPVIQIIQSSHSQQHGSNSSQQTQQASNQGNSVVILNSEDIMNDMIEKVPTNMKLIDPDTFSFIESPAAEYMFSDTMLTPNGFISIAAVGTQGVGKSTLLNHIAEKDAFKTRRLCPADYGLKHVTRGIDLHITKERLFLMDSQVSFFVTFSSKSFC